MAFGEPDVLIPVPTMTKELAEEINNALYKMEEELFRFKEIKEIEETANKAFEKELDEVIEDFVKSLPNKTPKKHTKLKGKRRK